MKFYLLILKLLLAQLVFSQVENEINLDFALLYNSSPIELYDTLNDENLSIETFKFYISNVQLLNQNSVVYTEENSYYLIDFEVPESLNRKLTLPHKSDFTHIKFNLGIDSVMNMSGVFGGDLDPTNGMYWTWQSGYINFKLEGKSDSCPSRKNRFIYHIGGFSAPFNSLQTVTLKAIKDQSIKINIDVAYVFEQINIETNHHLMSPNKKCMEFAELLPKIFSIIK